jgi:tRNA (adenine37-N6)-methyltransferase
MSRSSSTAATWGMPIVAGSFLLLTLSCFYCYHKRALRACETKLWKERQAERTGRIRAEVKLREALNTQSKKGGDTMSLKRIGTVVSPFTKRMGTPRQGALVPSSRAFIQFSIPMEAMDGTDQYSHLWIIFEFHANTDLASSKKTKIRPPRGGGIRIGQLATRSPHRPNPLGLSLVKIERVDAKHKRIHISALDLVNGTPVYDIKPCVPWDIPGHFDGVPLQVPLWVSQDDTLREVRFTESASRDLQEMITQNRLAPLYAENNEGFLGAKETIEQVLAQDPRASNKRGGLTHNEDPAYNIIFVCTQVEFRVKRFGIEIVHIRPIAFCESSFVDGIPLASENKS